MIGVATLVVIGIFIFLTLMYLKLEHGGRKIKIVAIILCGALIYFSVMGIFSSEEVDLTSPRGVVSAVYLYFGWLGQVASNLWDVGVETTHMVGNAIKINQTSSSR